MVLLEAARHAPDPPRPQTGGDHRWPHAPPGLARWEPAASP